MPVRRRVELDVDSLPYPVNPLVPSMQVIHDRPSVEVLRGCIRGCRFCQAGFIYRPFRWKKADTLCNQAYSLIHNTGYDELSLLSLSTSDHPELEPLIDGLLSWTIDEKVNLSLPSMRVDAFSPELAEKIRKVRESGLTFAAEAGTQRLRNVINKGITEENILSGCKEAFESGYTSVKLYFMMGLPTETDEDVLGIADLARRIEQLYYDVGRRTGQKMRRPDITVSTSLFIPKPFTPFQWEKQDTKEELIRKQRLLKDNIRSRNIHYAWHDFDSSVWEVVLARGDRRLSPVLLEGYRSGLFFDAWDDQFKLDKWLEILTKHGLSVEDFSREYNEEENLAWDHVDVGVKKKFLLSERHKAHEEMTTPSCREHCSGCGATCFGVGECYAAK